MKVATIAKSFTLGFVLLLAAGAFAASKASMELSHSVIVNGTTLKAGDYKLEWDGAGPNVEVSILQGKKVVAKVPAHVVELTAPAANNAAVTNTNADGTSSLAGIRFEGKKMALDIGESAGGMQAGSSK